jgi:hypothetical protein
VIGPKITRPENEIWGSDVNFDKYSQYDTEDTFVELQVYYFLTKHHSIMSKLNASLYNSMYPTNGADVCLTGDHCPSYDPNSKKLEYKDSPFRFFVNVESRTVPGPTTDGNPTIFDQVFKYERGKTNEFPVLFNESGGLPNAYFSSGDSSSNKSPKDCSLYRKGSAEHSSCISFMDISYPIIAFGQSKREGDFALMECVAYHELTHAFVHKFQPALPKYIWKAGLGHLSDPGSLNEAWADYFAAVGCGANNLRDKYPYRNIVNKKTCSSMVSQVHTGTLSITV